MAKYFIVVNGERIPLNVVKNMEFGGKMQVIVYESPGTNGGTVITTGRTNNTISLTGNLLLPFKSASERANPSNAFPTPMNTLNELKAKIQKVRDAGQPIQLIAPVTNDDSGNYLIEEFTANVVEGSEAHLPFTLTLQEYRQANIRASSVNLVNFQPANTFIQRLKDTNTLS